MSTPSSRRWRPAVALAWVAPCAGVAMVGACRVDPVVMNDYYAYVCAESDDTVDLVKFGPRGGTLEKRIPVGTIPTEIDGPHGLRVAPDGKHWFVSISHGRPFGTVVKYSTGDDIEVGQVQAGLFPASMDVSATTGFLFVVNFDLYGPMEPSTVSVIDSASMTEIARVPEGIMPHGSRLSPDGRFQYSVAMMTDELYEIDAFGLKVTRKLALAPDGDLPAGTSNEAHGEGHHDMAVTKPTWVAHHPQKRLAYVALLGINQVVEVDLDAWTVKRRFHTQKGPYNLSVSPDGTTLIVSCKLDGSTAFWDLGAGTQLASVKNTRKVTHGVAVSSDGKYAFVSAEGVGGEPGVVDVFDLKNYTRRAAIDVGKQASGIDFWKMELAQANSR